MMRFLALAALPALVMAHPAMAQQAGGDLLRADFIAQMDTEFQRRDVDRDGRVTRAELTQFELELAINVARQQNLDLFNRLDANRDGMISPGEFASLVGGVQTPDVTPLMQRFDPNRDQVITPVEYRAATLANFDRLDTDLNGVVSAAEMQAGGVQAGAGR